MKYSRVLLKLSGESLSGDGDSGIDHAILNYLADEIEKVTTCGTQLAIVLGGGNIFRGLHGSVNGFDRVQGDYMGMLATIINSVALQTILQKRGLSVKVLSGLPVERVAEPMTASKAISYLEKGHVIIIAGGTGNPLFTTDSAGALRAVEIQADILLKGTRVNGVYDMDPEKFKDAVMFDFLSYREAYEKRLKVMDLTAFTMCEENLLPICVFNVTQPGNLLKIIKGEKIGTLIK